MTTRNLLRGLAGTLLSAISLCGQTAAPQILPTTPQLDAFVAETTNIVFTCATCPTNSVFSYSGQGPLPAGLTFSSATRTISGVATTPNQRQSFAIIATSGTTQVAARSYQITTDRRLAFITPAALPAATAGIPVTRSVQVTLSSSWDTGSSTLPPSVNIQLPPSSPTLNLTGTFPSITAPTVYTFRLFASYPVLIASPTDAPSPPNPSAGSIFQTVERVFSITVNPLPTLSGILPPGQVGFPYVASLVTTGGTAPFTYSAVGNLPPGLSLNPNTGQLSGTPTLNGNFPFQVSLRDANGATAFATLTAAITGTPLQITSLTFPAARVAQSYSVPLTVTGGTPPFTWTIIGTTLPPPGIGISGTTLSGIPNTIGQFPFVIRVQDAAGLSAQANVSVAVTPALLTISSTTLPNGTPNAPYQASLSATGGLAPYAWTLGSGALPTGITLAANGVLSGTPTTSGTSNFSVRVTDTANSAIGYQGGAATRDFTITIGAGPLTIAPVTLPASIVGQPFTPTLTATGGTPPYTWGVASGSPPAGVVLNADGTFSGTPTTAGASAFTVQVRDSAGAVATRDFTLTTVAGLIISTATLDDAVVSVAYNVTLAAQNGTAPFTYSLVSGTLPAGITLSSAGILSGTPTTPGTANISIRAVDRGNLTATRAYTLLVRPALSLSTATLPDGNVGSGYTAQLAGDGGFPPYSFAVATGTLPPGLTLSAGGSLTGTPTTAGTASVTFRVTDARSFTATRALSIAIAQVSLPAVTVTQITDTTAPASQPAFGVALSSPFPAAIDGTVTLAFQPETGPADPDVRFANGGNTLNFSIPAGALNAVATAGAPFTFSSGTTAGTVTLTVVLRSGGQTLSPNPAAVRTVRINRAGPTITSVRINRTTSGFDVLVTGYSNTREVASGNLRFNPVPGVTLATSEFTLNLSTVFQTWFNSAPSAGFGTQFLMTIPFTVSDGTAASLSTIQVTLTNAAGSGSALGNF